jgi:hypothetical protein
LRASGRFELSIFTPETLIGFELYRGRAYATFVPPDWGGLTVRAAWSPAPGDAVDLEVQASATSVGELSSLEVEVLSQWMAPHEGTWTALAWTVEPRDARSGGLSYDGRETARVLNALTTLPVPESPGAALQPLVVAPHLARATDEYYVELVQPNDVARRVCIEASRQEIRQSAFGARYGLFGHDLEKGVVLRARLRGCWTHSQAPDREARRLYDEFVREPLPLGP